MMVSMVYEITSIMETSHKLHYCITIPEQKRLLFLPSISSMSDHAHAVDEHALDNVRVSYSRARIEVDLRDTCGNHR